MKFLLILLSLSNLAFADEAMFQKCEIKLTGKNVPVKTISEDTVMISPACEARANWILFQLGSTYDQAKYKHGNKKWKTLDLKDAKEEVAHP